MSDPTVSRLFDLTGRTALVTGATGHLGSAFARALAEAGARVVATSRRLESAQAAADALPGNGHAAAVLDYLDPAAIDDRFAAAAEAGGGGIDILVNNGHAGDASDWTNVTPEAFNRQLSNATGYFLLSRRFRDHVVERQATGAIVMIGSMYGVVGSYPDAYEDVCPASPVHYHALKGGIVHMTRHLAVYWAADGIRVNCLSPGPFPKDTAQAEMVARLRSKSPMGRMGEPAELKGALLLLASDAGSYITGQNLVVDGGWTAW